VLRALLTDIDGTITDPSRRISTGSIHAIRSLVDSGVEVVLASGNTSCFMDALCRMIGTNGTFIAENGGVFRVGFTGTLHIEGGQGIARQALDVVQAHFRSTGTEPELYSPDYRFSDLAFARTVPVDEVRTILAGIPVAVIDTGYAIHLQQPGISKGTALAALAREMGMTPQDFLATGDSLNDVDMIRAAGTGAVVANAHPDAKAAADYVSEKEYGEGFVDIVDTFFSISGQGSGQRRYSP
jgi:phosphoglycolate phosphatase (TIGR01487 family)